MSETTSQPRWRRLTAGALVLGPGLAVLSVITGLALGPEPESMRATFDFMAAHGSTMLVQDVLEAAGFATVLAGFASAARGLRSRGSTLGMVGSVLVTAGIVGFAMANAIGLSVVALAQLPDRDAAFAAARDITASGPLATLSGIGFALEVAGQLGMLLVLLGLWRARTAPIWPVAIAIVGMVVNAAVGTLAATLVADLLLLILGTWVAATLLRASRPATADPDLAPIAGNPLAGGAGR